MLFSRDLSKTLFIENIFFHNSKLLAIDSKKTETAPLIREITLSADVEICRISHFSDQMIKVSVNNFLVYQFQLEINFSRDKIFSLPNFGTIVKAT